MYKNNFFTVLQTLVFQTSINMDSEKEGFVNTKADHLHYK
jgi:hypothetical protein